MRQSLIQKLSPLAILVVLVSVYAYINPLRIEHYLVLGLLLVMLVASRATRDLAVTLVPAAIFGFTYDLMRLFLDRSYHEVATRPVFHLEQFVVGWMTPQPGDLGPVDFFREHHTLVVDILAGIWYSTHVPAVILFGLYLWWRHWRDDGREEDRLDKFFWGYLAFNVIGFVFWAIEPVAPPWYVETHGFAAPGHPILGSPAGLARVDAWLGYRHFADIYEQATYVFGAMPSLHVAPSIWIALWARKKWVRVLAWFYAITMCFFAVYLSHHYVVDVLAGGLLAFSVYATLAYTRLGEVPVRASNAMRAYVEDVFAPAPQEAAGE